MKTRKPSGGFGGGGYLGGEETAPRPDPSLVRKRRESHARKRRQPHIIATPGTCGGRTRIDGTRITTVFVWRWCRRYGRQCFRKLCPHIPDAATDAAIEWERGLRRRPLSRGDVLHALLVARAVWRTGSSTPDPLDCAPEHDALREALEIVCDEMRIDDVEGLIAVASSQAAINAIWGSSTALEKAGVFDAVNALRTASTKRRAVRR